MNIVKSFPPKIFQPDDFVHYVIENETVVRVMGCNTRTHVLWTEGDMLVWENSKTLKRYAHRFGNEESAKEALTNLGVQ